MGTTDVCIETTPVTLSYFKAMPEGDGVRIEWSTATETGNLGFKLFAGSQLGEQVNAEMVRSEVVNSLDRQDYAYTAAGIAAETYFIADVSIYGVTRMHGPFQLGNEYGDRSAQEPVDWAPIKRGSQRQHSGPERCDYNGPELSFG